MLLRKITRTVGVTALLAGLLPAAALAQGPADKRTYFTFNQPVALPGVTPQAGTYMFRLADTGSRRVVHQSRPGFGSSNALAAHEESERTS